MAEMTITALEPLTPLLTEEQDQAIAEIMGRLYDHPGKRFLVRDFPGEAPDARRLRARALRSLATGHEVVVEAHPEGFEIRLEEPTHG